MPESLRAACRSLLGYLSALLELSRAAGTSLLARVRPRLATLRSAVRSGIERLPDALASLRRRSANLLQRLAHTLAPQADVPVHAPEHRADVGEQDFAQMLADLGAEPPTLEQAVDSTLKDTTIRALSDNLHGLRDLGDQLARAEQDKLALAARVTELEAGVVAHIARELEQRAELLARTREQLALQRAKAGDWKRKAIERWHEIASLRSRVKELERALADARDGARPAPLPERPETSTRQEPRAGRGSSRPS
jgi:chromosome segregation ATPase